VRDRIKSPIRAIRIGGLPGSLDAICAPGPWDPLRQRHEVVGRRTQRRCCRWFLPPHRLPSMIALAAWTSPLRATPVVAKLDWLTRNVAYVSMMESGVNFVAADFPQANRLTVYILAAVTEHEEALHH
jgi:hypothetical protein